MSSKRRLRRDRQRTCDGRKRCRSRDEAERHMEVKGVPVRGASPYRCKHCKGWHVDWVADRERPE